MFSVSKKADKLIYGLSFLIRWLKVGQKWSKTQKTSKNSQNQAKIGNNSERAHWANSRHQNSWSADNFGLEKSYI